MASDGEDKLFVVYTGTQDGLGAYAVSSLDGGLTWSEPNLLNLSDVGQAPSHYSLFLDDIGRLHVVWSEADLATGNGEVLNYSWLDDSQQQWSTPVILAQREGDDYEADWPSLVENEGKLLLVYQDSFPATKWMRVSSDHGATWSTPVRIFPNYIGEYGAVRFVKDGSGNLHMILGNRIGSPAKHGIWHSVWLGDRWAEPTPVVTGLQVIDDVGGEGFDPSAPRAVISQGNVLMATWRNDGGAGFNGVKFVYTPLDVPPFTVVALQSPALVDSLAIQSDDLSVQPQPQVTSVLPSQVIDADQRPANTSPMMPLLLSAIPVVALVGIVILSKAVRRNR